jgi:(S)-3,5-dihydroxyphenylglycine transaminase
LEIRKESLHASVSDPEAGTMNFLNEVAARFPDAISLAAGRPYEGFYSAEDVTRYLAVFSAHLRASGLGEAAVRRWFTQYGRTNGQIGGLVARYLATDEAIHVPPEAVAVTVGCQEAMVLAVRGLCAAPDDVLLAVEPTYVGITGAARLLDVRVAPVPEDRRGLDPAAVAVAARAVRDRGGRPRALYVIPNFANPSGISLDAGVRRELLAVAAAEDLLILEDDPYGLFGLDDSPRSSLKALDTERQVIYLGSFAKSCFPGPRVGFLVADQSVVDGAGRRSLLAEELSAIKSMLTVNTSPIAQAVIGGILVEADYSLRAANAAKIAFYRRNLDALLSALASAFPAGSGGRWNRPDGGFFAVLDVPVCADEALLELSAREYGVLWTPMRFFYASSGRAVGGANAIRLSASYLDADVIAEGVRRLARLIEERS